MGKYIGATVTLLWGGLIWGGCDKKKPVREENKPNTNSSIDPCDDLTGISEYDIALRGKLAYVKESPIEESRCNNCNLYLPPGEGKDCGGCMLFKGPVHPGGYCTYWAPQI